VLPRAYLDQPNAQAVIRQREEESKQRFLAAFSGTCSVLKACRSAHVGRGIHYEWLKTDPDYPARFREAAKRGVQTLVDEAVRRAHEGVSKPVTYKGKIVFVDGRPLYTTEYSDQLLMFLLKAYDPERFKDRSEQTIRMPQSIEDLPEELLDSFIQRFEQLAAAKRARLQAAPAPASEQTVDVKPAEPGE
jgi:hypothetical protein